MKKAMTRPQLLAWLKAQAEDAFEGFVEDMSSHIGDGGDWEPVNDDTPQDELPLLINHESEVVKILAKNRLAGHSVYGPEVHAELDKLLQDDARDNDRYDMGFKQGRFYSIAKMYEELGETKLATLWKSWAWFDPYD
jgi:hypothetical protein